MHFWQNDRDLLRATAVTRGWNGYRNKSQHRRSTLEKKISRRSCRDSNLRPFNHESDAVTTELSPPRHSKHIAIPWRSLKHVSTILFFQACLCSGNMSIMSRRCVLSGMSVSWCCVRHVCTWVLCQACLYLGVVSGMFVPECCVRHVCTRCCVRHVCTLVLCQACLYPGVVSGMFVPGCCVRHVCTPGCVRHVCTRVFCYAWTYPGRVCLFSSMPIPWYSVRHVHNLVFF